MSKNKEIVAIVEDNETFRNDLIRKLETKYHLCIFESYRKAKEEIDESVDLVILDLRIPFEKGQSAPRLESTEKPLGVQLLEELKLKYPSQDIIVCTGEVTQSKQIIEIMKKGASDYFIKDQELGDRLFKSIDTLIEKKRLSIKEKQLTREVHVHKKIQRNLMEFQSPGLQGKYHFNCMLGESVVMQNLYKTIERICERSPESTVLITGETGTGKELVAWALHAYSPRSERVFVPVNVPALHKETIESELFGHVKGSFTGANVDKIGLFEEANGGTLFLDEIGDIPLNIQVDFLRVLEEKKIRKMGAMRDYPVDVRILAATNKNLEEEVRNGRFRADLFHRLNVIPIVVPPLRNRVEDIELLVRHFLDYFAHNHKSKVVLNFEDEAIKCLQTLPWEGNIRELKNLIERVSLICDGPIVTVEEIELLFKRSNPLELSAESKLLLKQPLPTLKEALSKEHKQNITEIESAVFKTQVFTHIFIIKKGNLTDVMTELSISRATTYDYFDNLVKEYILKQLCKAQGNLQILAKIWDVSFIDLCDSIASQNRILEYANALMLKADNDLIRVSSILEVRADELKEAIETLKMLSRWY